MSQSYQSIQVVKSLAKNQKSLFIHLLSTQPPLSIAPQIWAAFPHIFPRKPPIEARPQPIHLSLPPETHWTRFRAPSPCVRLALSQPPGRDAHAPSTITDPFLNTSSYPHLKIALVPLSTINSILSSLPPRSINDPAAGSYPTTSPPMKNRLCHDRESTLLSIDIDTGNRYRHLDGEGVSIPSSRPSTHIK